MRRLWQGGFGVAFAATGMALASCTAILGDGDYSVGAGPGDAGPRASSDATTAHDGCPSQGCGVCAPGARRCEGSQAQTCAGGANGGATGGQWVETAGCPYLCTGAGVCLGSCIPASTQCAGEGVQTCDSAGAWQDTSPCSFGCANGACEGACVPGTTRCSGVVAQLCDATGTWQTAQTCPYVCTAGACTGVCSPMAIECSSATPPAPQTCDATGAWKDQAACSQPTPDCQTGACTCLETTCSGACVNTQTDAHNCGACAHDCMGQTCSAGLCQPVAIATGQNVPWGIALGGGRCYWTNEGDGTVMSASLSAGATATTLASGQGTPMSITTDATNVYWVNGAATGAILACALGGCAAPIVLASGQASPWGIAVGGASVYFTVGTEALVTSVPPDGGAAVAPILVGSESATPFPIAVDATNAYWADSAGSVFSCALGGCGSTPTLLTTVAGGPSYGIAIDAANVYFTATGDGTVRKVSKIGTGAVVLWGTSVPLFPTAKPYGIAVDTASVYWTDTMKGTVMKAPIGGGAATTLASGQSTPTGIAVDATYVYWTNAVSNGAVEKVPK